MSGMTLDPFYGAGGSFAYTGTAANSGVIARGGNVLLWCTTDAYVECSVGAVAAAPSVPLPAYAVIVVPLPPGARLSAVQISAAGTCYYCPMS